MASWACSAGAMTCRYRNYTAIDVDGVPLWPGKYADKAAVEAEKLRGMPELAYRREMLLEIIPDGYKILQHDDLRFFKYGEEYAGYRFTLIAIDPAAKTGPQNDYTAIVTVDVYGVGKDMRIRVRPYPINARLNYEEIVERTLQVVHLSGGKAQVCVEGVGFQDMFLNLFKDRGVVAESVPVHGKSKEDRLIASAVYMQNGMVEFSDSGNEEMINQTLYFGSGDHDDLVDALSLAVLKSVEMANKQNNFHEYMKQQVGTMKPELFVKRRTMSDWVTMAKRQQYS